MDALNCCPCCGHVVTMHNPGGCYGDNLSCMCPLDRESVAAAAQQAAGDFTDG
jgi:hypothetical protein